MAAVVELVEVDIRLCELFSKNKISCNKKVEEKTDNGNSKTSPSSSPAQNKTSLATKKQSSTSTAQDTAKASSSSRHKSKQAQSEEVNYVEDLRKVIHALSDIKILLTNVFSREYIFESLQQDKKI